MGTTRQHDMVKLIQYLWKSTCWVFTTISTVSLVFLWHLPKQANPAAEEASPAAVGKLLTEQMWTLGYRLGESKSESLSLRLFLANRRTKKRKHKNYYRTPCTWKTHSCTSGCSPLGALNLLSLKQDCSLGWVMSSSLPLSHIRSSWNNLLVATVVVVFS